MVVGREENKLGFNKKDETPWVEGRENNGCLTELLQNNARARWGCKKGRGKWDERRSGTAQIKCQVLVHPPQLSHRRYFCVQSHGGPRTSSSAGTHPFPLGPTSPQPPPKPSTLPATLDSSCSHHPVITASPAPSLPAGSHPPLPLCICHARICLPHPQLCSLQVNYPQDSGLCPTSPHALPRASALGSCLPHHRYLSCCWHTQKISLKFNYSSREAICRRHSPSRTTPLLTEGPHAGALPKAHPPQDLSDPGTAMGACPACPGRDGPLPAGWYFCLLDSRFCIHRIPES